MLPWLNIIMAIEPGIVNLIKDFKALLGKHPQMTPAQLAAFLTDTAAGVHAVNDDTLALIAQDQGTKPPATQPATPLP